ncbi:MAG: transglycosylase domain-containing protein [Oscillospiraceae bacterium]|nr:transglycosylase domain-containing protein [Oscillospiraceae bacterium]
MDKKKKIKYIKIKEEQPKKRSSKKKHSRAAKNFGRAMTIVGTTFSSMLLILVIMVCIVATVLAVYVLDFADNSYDANLRDVEMKYTSFIYGYDENNDLVEIKRLAADENRVWVDYEDISQNIIDATVAAEDKRFYTHKGVDWYRTAGAFFSNGDGGGGSTITQQLIKNITGDNERSWERKLREIFRALSLEEKYTKIDILESYLNRIWFGGMVYGVGAASQYYFGKDASELNIGEAAVLAGMIRNPGKMSPYFDLARSKQQQNYVLRCMYEQGMITTKEYEDFRYNKIQVHFAKPVYGDDYGYIDERTLVDDNEDDFVQEVQDDSYEAYKWNGDYEVSQDWYVDAAIDQVINDYADLKGITYTSAKNELYNGGYKIYINENMKLQKILEEKYRDPYTVLSKYDPSAPEEDLIQSAFVIMDYTGTVQAVVGGLGEKPGDGAFNRATQATRSPGSTMKPISTYSLAVQKNLITYSTLIPDARINIGTEDEPELWPKNYGEIIGDGTLRPAWYAVQHSTNTIAARVGRMNTPKAMYNQLTQMLGFTTLVEQDIALSPMSLGALTNGAKLVEVAAAYQIFGNGGVYYRPMFYSKVEDSKGNVILEQDFYGTQAVDSDTAWVTNRMIYKVVNGDSGTGRLAKLDNVEVIGKTGTSNAETDLLFMGLTPEYIGGLWIGYDDSHKIYGSDGWRAVATVWKNVMQDIQDTSQVLKFVPDPSVIEKRYCTKTGLLATNKCSSTEIGYYRESNLPDFCTGDHENIQKQIIANNPE